MITFNDLMSINDNYPNVKIKRFDDDHDILKHTIQSYGRCCYLRFSPNKQCNNCIDQSKNKSSSQFTFQEIASNITKLVSNPNDIRYYLDCPLCTNKTLYIDDFMSINHRDYVIISDFNHHFSISNHLKQIDRNAYTNDVITEEDNHCNYLFIVVRHGEDSQTFDTLKPKFKDKLVCFRKIFRNDVAYYGFEDNDTNLFKIMKMLKDNGDNNELICLNPNRFNLDTVTVPTFLENFKILSKFFPHILDENYLDSGIVMY